MKEMADLTIFLEDFKADMLQKFRDHDEKWGQDSVTQNDWNGIIPLNIDELRNEISYHYAKWLYRGVVKQTLPEEDTLTNLANVCFLLWLTIRQPHQQEGSGNNE